jgi:hypothetical protein
VKRREFMTLLGGGAAAWPLAARAEQATLPVIGLLTPQSHESATPFLEAFRRGLAESGLVEGQTSSSNIVSQKAGSIGLRKWPPISPAAR